MLSKRLTASIVIIFFNLIPIAGVMFYNWSPFEMFWLFWMETLIISVFNTVRVLTSQGYQPATRVENDNMHFNILASLKYLLVRIFIFLFYSLFIIVFIGFLATSEKDPIRMVMILGFQDPLFNLALLLCIISNLYYLTRYFFMNRAYIYTSPAAFASLFDGRQIVMHVAVVFGAVGATFLFKDSKNPHYAAIWVISSFCLVKCLFELIANRNEESKRSDDYIVRS